MRGVSVISKFIIIKILSNEIQRLLLEGLFEDVAAGDAAAHHCDLHGLLRATYLQL